VNVFATRMRVVHSSRPKYPCVGWAHMSIYTHEWQSIGANMTEHDTASANLLSYTAGWRDLWRGGAEALIAAGLVPAGICWPGEAQGGVARFERRGLTVKVWCRRQKVPRGKDRLDFSMWFVEREPVGLLPGYGPLLAEQMEQIHAMRSAAVMDTASMALKVQAASKDKPFLRFKRDLLKAARRLSAST
jgi:hypothetical protein